MLTVVARKPHWPVDLLTLCHILICTMVSVIIYNLWLWLLQIEDKCRTNSFHYLHHIAFSISIRKGISDATFSLLP